jgi:Flp pilus assembly protein TadB
MFSSIVTLLAIFAIILLVSLCLKILRLGIGLIVIAGIAAFVWHFFLKKR